MATDTAGEEFVTIVPVGEGRPIAKDPSFVTVLTVGAAAGAAEVVVRRPRGDRLGLGLKFEGGSAAAEKVRRLLVQSCAEDSPAANASTPWGHLIPGDEILAIDGVSVSELTRIDCVRRLKDSDETLTLLVRHFEIDTPAEQIKENMTDSSSAPTSNVLKQVTEIVRPTTLPPPVPPRKLGKKNSFKDKSSLQTVGEQTVNNDGSQQNDKENVTSKHNGMSTLTKLSRKSSFDSHLLRQNKESIAYLKKGSPEEVRRLVRRLSDGKVMPPDAEIYIDLLSSEWERCLVLADAESDDTGSSISTVVDRLGSMASSVENSIPSTPIMQQKTLDIQKVLNYIENIDADDILRDMTAKKPLSHIQIESKLVEKSSSVLNGSNHNSITTNSSTTEETLTSKKVIQNDKNNNSTVFTNKTNIHAVTVTEKVSKNIDNKTTEAAEKPKPMPRSARVERSASERKPRPIPIPETPPSCVPESLLTPTKKNCIETWLKRSEAEMNNNKNSEKLEESSLPEVLPRLIDFVPKPQFKENVHEAPQSLSRPTIAPPPPPPPAETREDGSGASLDTIGEMDESSDVTDNAKPITTTKTKDKSSFERSFWEDRINKSDTEDKSLSNDETPLPSCPRQPPDGVETPSDVVEKPPDPPSRLPPLHFLRPRYSYISRTQDARSEASVKDKIAMFSNDHAISTDRIDKCGTLPNKQVVTSRKSTTIMYNYPEAPSLDRRLTKSQDNLDDVPRYSKKIIETRPEVSGGFGSNTISSNYGVIKSSRPLHSDNKPLFYGSTTVLPSSVESTYQPPIYHMRSTSDDSGSKNISKHKSNLEHLIEQRKKSMSKLRGLAIPEIQGPVVGLPEIKIQDNVTKSFLLKKPSENSNNKINSSKQNNVKPVILNENKWKTNFTNNIPKYSPAFKRKSLQVYTPSSMSKESTPERSFSERIETLNKMNHQSTLNNKARTLDLNDTPRQLSTSILPSKGYLTNMYSTKKEYSNGFINSRDYKNLDIKICTVTDIVDSDNDSAMSSTQSSYRSSASSPMHTLDTIESDSSRLSPRISNYTYSVVKSEMPSNKSPIEKSYEEYIKRSVCRSMSSDTNVSLSSSAGSAATSGSQASCSSLESSVADSDKRKVSKTCTIDTLNRRNILASAKCRSGRDAKLTSPVIETKFSHESGDRSPSPVPKASERLSTLTTSVSAVSNKGENRRRNKIIAETDSDSDSDLNIRQRKADYKNSRLKRNSSNKSKSNDTNSESPKAEDAPRVISEKIIKEINKAGLDNFTATKPVVLDKHSFDIIKTDIKMMSLNKEEKSLKNNISIIPKESKVCDIKYKEKPSTKVNSNKNSVNENGRIEMNGGNSIQNAKISTRTIYLKRGAGTGVGVILAGGIDCEAKDVTVHRILSDSVAARAGLKRGVKVRSINGFAMTGLTHAQSVTILKEQRSEVVIEVENETTDSASDVRGGSEKAESKVRKEVEGASGGSKSSSVVTVLVEKAGGGAGLGFGLDGGRDSPRGDCPLTIKKLFAGGAAAQSGQVLVGAVLLSAGGQSMEGFTRTQAWAALKALPAGPVALVLRNPKE